MDREEEEEESEHPRSILLPSFLYVAAAGEHVSVEMTSEGKEERTMELISPPGGLGSSSIFHHSFQSSSRKQL